MNLQEIIGTSTTAKEREGVRSYVDEPEADASDWTDHELLFYVNMEHKHLFSVVRNYNKDYFGRTHIFPMVASTYEYWLPMDIVNPRRIEWIRSTSISGSSPNYVVDEANSYATEIYETSLADRDALPSLIVSTNVAIGNGYYLFSDKINFVPTQGIDSTKYCRIFYLPSAPDLHMAKPTAATASTITLGTNAATGTVGRIKTIDNYYKDMRIEIVSGTGIGQLRRISKYAGSTKVATLDSDWATTPTTAAVYSIVSPVNDDFQELLILGASLRAKGIKVEDETTVIGRMYGEGMKTMMSSLYDRNHQKTRSVRTTKRSASWY